MPEERNPIDDLRQQMTTLVDNSGAAPGGKAIAALMAAIHACRAAGMSPERAIRMFKFFYGRDPRE